MKKFKDFNNILVSKYKGVFNKKLEKYNKFRDSNFMKNESGEITFIKTFEDKMKDDLLFTIFKTDAQSVQYSNDNKIGIFLTVTLDSFFHESLNNKKYSYDDYVDFHVARNNFVWDISESELEDVESFGLDPLDYVRIDRNKVIKDGYKVLQDSFRRIYNKFSVDREYIKVPYSRVIEPHKSDFTPHLHAILFIDKEYLDKFLKHIKRTIKIMQNKNSLGKQFDIEVLRDTKKTGGYITKYIRKSLELEFVKGWSQLHKIRLFQTSRDIIPRYVFKIVSGKISINDMHLDNSSYIHEILKRVSICVQNDFCGSRIFYGSADSNFKLLIIKDIPNVDLDDNIDRNMRVVDYIFFKDNKEYSRKINYKLIPRI